MPCRANHVHERSLVEKYKDRPFVILGVNVDPEVETFKRSEHDQHLTWRSIWDGKSHINSRVYQVQYLPTVFLIDHLGRRARMYTGKPDGKTLERDIEMLLQEAEQAAP
jgi:hypothetical protein